MRVNGEILDRTTSYFQEALSDDLDSFIDRARTALKGVQYDTLVGTGMSGALIVPTLARALDQHWLIVRKPKDGSHSWHPFIGKLGRRWIFVDDFIDSGATRKRVLAAIQKEAESFDFKTTYVGDYLYVDYPSTFQPARKSRSSNYLKSAYTAADFSSASSMPLSSIFPPVLTVEEEDMLVNFLGERSR